MFRGLRRILSYPIYASKPFTSLSICPAPLRCFPQTEVSAIVAATPSYIPGMLSRQPFSSSSFEGPTAIDYATIMPEEDFHRRADDIIHDLLERFEEYGDLIQLDGFDVDYGNQVLTLKLGSLGTYVINKQTPNRQIWLSSPVSGPARFDWDPVSNSWVYRRTKASLVHLLEKEVEALCGTPVALS